MKRQSLHCSMWHNPPAEEGKEAFVNGLHHELRKQADSVTLLPHSVPDGFSAGRVPLSYWERELSFCDKRKLCMQILSTSVPKLEETEGKS